MNAAALAVGLLLAILGRAARNRLQLPDGAWTLAAGLVLSGVALTGITIDGATRWIAVAGLSIQPLVVVD